MTASAAAGLIAIEVTISGNTITLFAQHIVRLYTNGTNTSIVLLNQEILNVDEDIATILADIETAAT